MRSSTWDGVSSRLHTCSPSLHFLPLTLLLLCSYTALTLLLCCSYAAPTLHLTLLLRCPHTAICALQYTAPPGPTSQWLVPMTMCCTWLDHGHVLYLQPFAAHGCHVHRMLCTSPRCHCTLTDERFP